MGLLINGFTVTQFCYSEKQLSCSKTLPRKQRMNDERII
jgi:hypothetical protein